MSFGLQALNDWGGDGSASDDTGNSGILSALENIGVNFAAGAATVGLQAFGQSQGVSSAYTNPAAVAYNSALLTRRPGTVSPVGAALGVSGNTVVFAGLALVAALVAWQAFRRKG